MPLMIFFTRGTGNSPHRILFFNSCRFRIKIELDKFSRLSLSTNQSSQSTESEKSDFKFVFFFLRPFPILPFRRRNSSYEYFHFFVRLHTNDIERLFTVESFCLGRIWARFKSSSESPRTFDSVSHWASGEQLEFERDSNSIQISRWTDSIDESTLSICSRTSTKTFSSLGKNSFVEFGLETLSSFGIVVISDVTTNSSRRSSNVLELTRSMCHKPSHGHSLHDDSSTDCLFICLGSEWTSSTTNECLGFWSRCSVASAVGLRNWFGKDSRRKGIFRQSKSFRTETIGEEIKQRNERSDASSN